MTQTDLMESLSALGFKTPRDDLHALLKTAAQARHSPWQVTEALTARELRERDSRNLQARKRCANLGKYKLLSTFDWQHPKMIDRSLVTQLCELEFIEAHQNVLLRGPAGVGKTMIAKNLGLLALQHGYTVRFISLAALLFDLLKQESLPALERRMRRYITPTLLIIDEIGYVPCDRRSADLLFNVISRRHEVAATCITTNLSFKQWATVFPGAACVSALVDRFVQHCYVVDIDANSWREKYARSFAAKRISPKPSSDAQPT